MSHLSAIAVALAVIWVLSLLVNPRTNCGRCEGTGRHGWSRPDAWGDCRRCGGNGKRLRFGARTANRMILRREL